MGVYSVNIVGESKYQDAVRRCVVGEKVRLRTEIDNPHDNNAVAVETMRGAKIGYLPRDSFLRRLIFVEAKAIGAELERRTGDKTTSFGIVLSVTTTEVATNAVYAGRYKAPAKPSAAKKKTKKRGKSAFGAIWAIFFRGNTRARALPFYPCYTPPA